MIKLTNWLLKTNSKEEKLYFSPFIYYDPAIFKGLQEMKIVQKRFNISSMHVCMVIRKMNEGFM